MRLAKSKIFLQDIVFFVSLHFELVYTFVMKSINKSLIIMLCCALVMGVCNDVQAQNKKKSGKKKATTTKTVKKQAAPPAPVVHDIELPYNSNDCLFAIELQLDQPYGPTTAPDGGGRMQEVVADKAHPNLFEREHNSVWYKVKIPYNGKLEISIEQKNKWDDYDFLVYKNTGVYFSNQVLQNKVLPVAVNLGQVDSNALAAEVLAQNNPQQRPRSEQSQTQPKKAKEPEEPVFEMPAAPRPTIGMSVDATDKMLTKKQLGGFIQAIPVRMGEEYYIVLDNCGMSGQGHTITVSVHADAYEPLVLFYDRKARKYVDVDLMILERGGAEGERPIVKDAHYRGGKVKFVPGFSYTLYAKRDGYFSVYREFNSRDLMLRDTIMLYNMERTERGSTFPVSNVYFEDSEAELIAGSDTVLMDYVAMFRNHPDITFLVKAYVSTYGVNAEEDMLLSLERAKTVKDFFVKNGIDANRITTAGMTRNEIKRAAAAALDTKSTFSNIKVELIITGKTTDK